MNIAATINVLMAAKEGIKPLGERLGDGLQVFIIGILAVFGVLAVLWGVLALFKVFFYDIPKKRAEANKKKSEEIVPVDVNATAPTSEEETPTDDTQLIAVITAAIAAYTAENGKPALPFRVVSYKRVKGANGWNGADENETV